MKRNDPIGEWREKGPRNLRRQAKERVRERVRESRILKRSRDVWGCGREEGSRSFRVFN